MPDRRLDVWEKLADPEAVPLLEAAAIAVADGITPASVMRLRKSFPGTSVAEAIELASARARADAKFADPSAMMLDRAGLEQATSESLVACSKQATSCARTDALGSAAMDDAKESISSSE